MEVTNQPKEPVSVCFQNVNMTASPFQKINHQPADLLFGGGDEGSGCCLGQALDWIIDGILSLFEWLFPPNDQVAPLRQFFEDYFDPSSRSFKGAAELDDREIHEAFNQLPENDQESFCKILLDLARKNIGDHPNPPTLEEMKKAFKGAYEQNEARIHQLAGRFPFMRNTDLTGAFEGLLLKQEAADMSLNEFLRTCYDSSSEMYKNVPRAEIPKVFNTRLSEEDQNSFCQVLLDYAQRLGAEPVPDQPTLEEVKKAFIGEFAEGEERLKQLSKAINLPALRIVSAFNEFFAKERKDLVTFYDRYLNRDSATFQSSSDKAFLEAFGELPKRIQKEFFEHYAVELKDNRFHAESVSITGAEKVFRGKLIEEGDEIKIRGPQQPATLSRSDFLCVEDYSKNAFRKIIKI